MKARIAKLDGLSGHADKEGLIEWLQAFKDAPQKVFLVHGDDAVCTSFANHLRAEFGYDADAPFSGSVYDLANDVWEKQTVVIVIQKETARQRENRGIFEVLVAAGERLMRIVRKHRECSNKDIKKFTNDINALCDKWDF